MASSPLSVFPARQGNSSEVYLGDTLVGWIYRQGRGDGYRFRLVNYPQSMSKLFSSMKDALKGIEREVL